MRPRSTCTTVMGREECGEGKELLMTLVFIDDVTADKSNRMNSEVFRAILSAHIQPNAAKLIGRHFTVQMDNDLKHTPKATKEFF